MLDLAVAGSATVLPDVLDFDRDREASPARMNRAMEYLYLRLAAATALQPEFESAIAELQAVGLDRLNEVLGPIFAESAAIAAQLGAIRTAWLTGAPFDQLLNDLTAQVTARLATVDAAVAAQLSGVAGQLAAQNTAVSDKLASLSPTAKWPEASAAEARAGTASRLLSAAILWSMEVPVALADGSIIPVDLSAGINFTVTLGGNRVLGNPTNGKPGQAGSIFVTQDGTGGRVLSFGANYVPDDLSSYPVLNMPAGTVTELRYKVALNGKVRIYGGKPASRSLRIQDYMIQDGNQGTYSPGVYSPGSISRTVTIYPIAGSNGAIIYRRDSSFNVVENLATVGIGFLPSFTYTVPADQSLFFIRNSNGGNIGVRVEENS